MTLLHASACVSNVVRTKERSERFLTVALIFGSDVQMNGFALYRPKQSKNAGKQKRSNYVIIDMSILRIKFNEFKLER